MVTSVQGVAAVDIRRAAMDFLARREHSVQELQAKLLRKFTEPRRAKDGMLEAVIQSDDTLAREQFEDLLVQQLAILSQENLQSDERYVESFINGRKAQGKGPLRIRQELDQKGVSCHLVEDYLKEDSEYWFGLAEATYLKKFGDSIAKDYQEKSKRIRFMLYRGFSHAHLQALIK